MKNIKLLSAIAALMLVSAITYAQSVSIALTQAPCNANGVLTATMSSMTSPYTVEWFEGYKPVATHTGVTSNTDAYNTYSGAYVYVKVTDANNTVQYGYFQSSPPFTYQVTTSPAVCPSLGSASATVTGGTAPYSYQWYTMPGLVNVGTGQTISLPAGEYGVTITDANGCAFGSTQHADSVFVGNVSNINYTVNSTKANCTNGTATVTNVTGGVTPYTYLWSTASTASGITGLSQGYYNVKVTDAQGCYTQKGIFVQQAYNIGTNIAPTPATCLQNDGKMIAFGSNGVSPYSYHWSTGANTQTISGLISGIYRVKITDANGCFAERSAFLSSSTPVNVTYTSTPSSCTTPNGTASLTISGGTAPYSVQWYTSPGQTGTTATGLAPGRYSFKVTDATGCVRTGAVVVDPVSILNLNVSRSNTTCTQSNGAMSVSVTGGTSPYTYSWSNNGTGTSISNLGAGYYSVTVTDAVGCSKTSGGFVKVNSPVNVSLNTTHTSCIYSNNGNITATSTGGTAPYTYSWSNGGNTTTIATLPQGRYSVVVTDANGCRASARTYVGTTNASKSCYCTITGTVYNDANGNCIKDAGEQGIQNIQVHCSGYGYAYTNANGVYSFKVPTGSYTITESIQAYYPLASCQNRSATVNVTASANCSTTVDFANTIATIHDVHANVWNYTCPVPGYPYKQVMTVANKGTVAETSVAGGFKTDAQIFAPSFSPSGVYTGSGSQYNIPANALSLNPGATQWLTATYNMPTNIPLGTVLDFYDTAAYSAPMSNWLQDYSPWNNVKRYQPVVVGSYDPNFKEVSPAGQGPKHIITHVDSTLDYNIHFQNLGTYKALNIFILDTLDKDLDWSSLQVLYKSHPCEVTISEDGVLKFQFDNINLPAKQDDEDGSNGMVTYTIKTKKNLPLGTEFTNSAAIYFDFNEPVITNTTLNTLGTVSVETVKKSADGQITVYPNPTSSSFTIRIDGNKDYKTMRIMNSTGQVVKQQEVSGKYTQVDMMSVPAGLYFIIMDSPQGSTVEKVEKL